jgi:uncharacterized protein YbjT (DUF2867 family)
VTAPVLVTGGTGNLGRAVVARLKSAGRDVRVLTRRQDAEADGVEVVRGDLALGEGVAAALKGVSTIVHCAGNATGDEVLAQHLVRAAAAAGVGHLVNISVVGADRVPVVSRLDRLMFGYFASKLAAERVVAGSGVPYTTLRATQFHDLVLTTARAMAKLPVIPVPGVRFQPIDAGEVAARLTELTLAEPAGLVAEMGGPQVYEMADLLRGYLTATHRRRPLVIVRTPGRAGRALRAGANLAPGEAVGRRRWEDFLAERTGG